MFTVTAFKTNYEYILVPLYLIFLYTEHQKKKRYTKCYVMSEQYNLKMLIFFRGPQLLYVKVVFIVLNFKYIHFGLFSNIWLQNVQCYTIYTLECRIYLSPSFSLLSTDLCILSDLVHKNQLVKFY